MRFPTVFHRRVGEPTSDADLSDPLWFEPLPGCVARSKVLVPELGSDTVPLLGEPLKRWDNLHASRLADQAGFTSQRVVVGYQAPRCPSPPR
jgi:hypothetical protein